VPPHAANHAGYLARRLRRQMPEAKLVVGLWTADGEIGTAKERLAKLGVDEVVALLPEAAEVLRKLAGAGKPAQKEELAKRSARN
jgi:hypothetical protein